MITEISREARIEVTNLIDELENELDNVRDKKINFLSFETICNEKITKLYNKNKANIEGSKSDLIEYIQIEVGAVINNE